jgi:Zn-dependent alcohol dehydrogenases
VVTRAEGALKPHAGRYDFILDTVSAPHDLDAYLRLLKRDGTLTLVGLPDQPPVLGVANLIFRRGSLAGSLIGGIAETQEMLDYCGAHDITADVERIAIADINQAYERMLASDVRYRFVIDLATLKG